MSSSEATPRGLCAHSDVCISQLNFASYVHPDTDRKPARPLRRLVRFGLAKNTLV